MLERILNSSHLKNVSHETEDIVKLIRFIQINGLKISLEENAQFLTKIPEELRESSKDKFISYSSNLLYYGRNGSGKSCNLFLLSAWAHYSGCI